MSRQTHAPASSSESASAKPQDRLYQELSQTLLREISEGVFPVGSRLPAERELATRYDVSRTTVRETMIALEVQGVVEVRVGSGAYVLQMPGAAAQPGINVTAFELTEARLLIEGESAALAATQASEKDIAAIAASLEAIARETNDVTESELADRDFHLGIARATRNRAIYEAVEHLWNQRESSPECALVHAKARTANIKPVVEEHSAILDALRAGDPAAARNAMRAHLSAVLESLLFATEEMAVEKAREASRSKRAIYARLTA
ncbi:FadR/GntR family transcriptional regulator [Novosphingobium profundi]|uniref:FadR/GntR family transcriptional regulator n=1 Tax=Novosphingobium profundi TaxID=1774954 RepID=UPI001CFD6C80|nr:FadR/GntR family transcriptional regulator [Novosphingobium profundi]